jgi:hypothetical protein
MDITLVAFTDVLPSILDYCDLPSRIQFMVCCRSARREVGDYMYRTCIHVECYDANMFVRILPDTSGPSVNFFVKLDRQGYLRYFIRTEHNTRGWSMSGSFGTHADDDVQRILNMLDQRIKNQGNRHRLKFQVICNTILFKFDRVLPLLRTSFHLLAPRTINRLLKGDLSAAAFDKFVRAHRWHKFVVNADD